MSKSWSTASRDAENRREAERRDREAVTAQRNRRKPWPQDRQRKAQREANARRDQLPMIVPQVVPDVVEAALADLRAARAQTPAQQRAAEERRANSRPPLVSPELAPTRYVGGL